MNTADAHRFAEQAQKIQHLQAVIDSMHTEIIRAKVFAPKPQPTTINDTQQAEIDAHESAIARIRKGSTN